MLNSHLDSVRVVPAYTQILMAVVVVVSLQLGMEKGYQGQD